MLVLEVVDLFLGWPSTNWLDGSQSLWEGVYSSSLISVSVPVRLVAALNASLSPLFDSWNISLWEGVKVLKELELWLFLLFLLLSQNISLWEGVGVLK